VVNLWELPLQGNATVLSATDGRAAALGRGVKIGPNQQFFFDDAFMAATAGGYFKRGFCAYVHYTQGYWVNVSNRYLGLKFSIRGRVHYAWARLSVQEGDVYIHATLTGYAYETIPGKSIKAGQTKEAAEEARQEDFAPSASLTNPIPDTPQPASLGALAMGAHGLSVWRRESISSLP
jgi:hypothetical protein